VRPKAYPRAKQEHLANIEETDLHSFVEEIPERALVRVQSCLPPQAGFRPESRDGIQLRIKKLIRHLRALDTAEHGRAVESWRTLWIAWVEHHDELETLLQSFDNGADFKGDEEVAQPNSDLDIKCFEFLLQANAEAKVSRQVIERFYRFGYFVPDPRIEELISKATSETQIRRRQVLEQLPDHFAAIRTEVSQLGESVRRLESTSEMQAEASERFGTRLDKLQEEFERLKNAPQFRQVGKDVEALRTDLQGLRGNLGDLGKRLGRLEEDLSGARKDSAARFSGLEAVLQGIQESLAELRRLPPAGPSGTPSGGPPSPPIGMESLPIPRSMKRIGQRSEALTLLSSNYQGAGLVPGVARAVARETLAALSLGQIPMFRGSLGKVLARSTALSLAGHRANLLRIPVGLLDDMGVIACVRACEQESRKNRDVGALILESMNLSALELWGPSLLERTMTQFSGLPSDDSQGHVHLIGTLAEGPSALSITPLWCELGPILDTAFFSATMLGGMPKELVGGQMSFAEHVTLARECRPAGSPEVEALIAAHPGMDGPVWSHAVRAASSKLGAWEEAAGGISSTDSLLYGWLIPRALSLELDLKGFLDQARTNLRLSQSDPRLTKLEAALTSGRGP